MSTSMPGADALDTAAVAATSLARETRSLDDRLTLVAVRMTYIALSFFAACFYFAMTYLQLVNVNGMWKPAGIHRPSLALGIAEMALVLLSGLVYFWGQWAGLYARNFGRLTLALAVASLLGVAAIVLHIGELHNPGFSLQGGGYPSVFIFTEGVYTFMLLASVIVLLGLTNRAAKGLFQRSGVAVEAFGEFWGWMSAIALLNFMALWVQPFFPIS